MEDDDDEEVETRDKYEFNPPPDEDRYTHGVAPRPAVAREKPEDEAKEEEEAGKSETDSDDNEPQWVEGQIRQGGNKLKFVDGHTDYHRDVLNETHPDKAFIEDFDRGETYSDYSLTHKRWMSVSLADQDLDYAEYRASLNASMPTHNWTQTPLQDYTAEEYYNVSEYNNSHDIYEYDIMRRQYKHTKTFMYHDSLILGNKTRLLGHNEARPKFIPPGSEPVPDEAGSGWRILKALDDADRWKNGELPMPLNEEDEEEIKKDEEKSINEQLCEAAEHGATGMFNDLVALGGNVSYHLPPDDMAPLHYAALNGHTDIVKILLQFGVDVNATDSWDRTPLHWAAYNGHTEVAQVLYDAGAHVMAKTKGGSTPYAMASLFMHTHDEVIDFFRAEERKYNKELGGVTLGVSAKERKLREERRKAHPLSSAYE